MNKEGLAIENLIEKANEKFSPEKYDSHHIYKSLSYFEEADDEPMPEMIKEVDWGQVKSFFIDRVEDKL